MAIAAIFMAQFVGRSIIGLKLNRRTADVINASLLAILQNKRHINMEKMSSVYIMLLCCTGFIVLLTAREGDCSGRLEEYGKTLLHCSYSGVERIF